MQPTENGVTLGALVGNTFWQEYEGGIGGRGLAGRREEAKVEAKGRSTRKHPVLVGVEREGGLEEELLRCEGQDLSRAGGGGVNEG